MRKSIGMGAFLCVSAIAMLAHAAPYPVIAQDVGVCDPNSPKHCAAPDANGNLPVTLSGTGGGIITTPAGVTSTDASFTVTLGGTYQTVLAASATRKGCTFQNPSTATESVTFKFGTQTTAYTINPGQSISCNLSNGQVEQSLITATATTTSHAVAGTSQ